jgi:peptidoglycan/xylan/chitin deacetylase (PgdA/CDA1 family)
MVDALVKILGVSSALLRPPYGNYNDDVLAVSEALDLSRAFLLLLFSVVDKS